jgi:hypothetical protein
MCITSKQKLALYQENYNTAVVARKKKPFIRGCNITEIKMLNVKHYVTPDDVTV